MILSYEALFFQLHEPYNERPLKRRILEIQGKCTVQKRSLRFWTMFSSESHSSVKGFIRISRPPRSTLSTIINRTQTKYRNAYQWRM